MKKVAGAFVDYPILVSLGLLCLATGHFLVAQRWPVLNLAAALAASSVPDPRDSLMTLSLGVASVAALVGGFAGVVVVFGLGGENDRFRLLRRAGKRRLRANWISVVLSSLTAAFGSLIAAATIIGFGVEAGLWALELFLLFAAHGAIRLTALLAGLARIVDQGDTDAERDVRVVATDELLPDS